MTRIFSSLVMAIAIAPAAWGQAPQSLESAWETSRPTLQLSLAASSQTAASSRAEQILSRGGAVKPQDKVFLNDLGSPDSKRKD